MLSDGERSFLGRLCLMPLLRDSEALVLLDEPEVHFKTTGNDTWFSSSIHRSHSRDDAYAPLQPCHVI